MSFPNVKVKIQKSPGGTLTFMTMKTKNGTTTWGNSEPVQNVVENVEEYYLSEMEELEQKLSLV